LERKIRVLPLGRPNPILGYPPTKQLQRVGGPKSPPPGTGNIPPYSPNKLTPQGPETNTFPPLGKKALWPKEPIKPQVKLNGPSPLVKIKGRKKKVWSKF